MKLPILDFLRSGSKKARVTRAEFDTAFTTARIYKELIASEGWAKLMSVAQSQMLTRTELIIQPEIEPRDGLEKQLMRGERAGIALLSRTPHAIIEDAEYVMDLYRNQEKLDEDVEPPPPEPDASGAVPADTSEQRFAAREPVGGFRRSP